MKKYKCLVCGKETLEEPTGDSFQVCPYCGWEDNDLQSDMPDFDGWANSASLNQAKELVKSGKNVDGGSLPWSEWIKNRELTKC